MPRLRPNPWILAPALVLLGVLLTWWQRSRVPARADWQAAAERVRAGLQPGDGVAWAPYWAGEGRLFLHGLPGFHLADVAQADLARYPRVWLMGAFGRDADDLPAGHRLAARERFGGVTLDLVEVGGERVVSDLYADLEQVRVVRGGRNEQVCDFWDGRGWHCDLRRSPDATRQCLAQPVAKRLGEHRRRRSGGDPDCGLNPWLHVSRDVRVIERMPRRCVWAHPIQGRPLQIEWPGAAAGDTLVVDYGFADQAVAWRNGPVRTRPATLKVRRGGQVLGEQVVEPTQGWRRWRLPLGGEGGPLTIEITTESTTDAHLCIDPTIRVDPTVRGGGP